MCSYMKVFVVLVLLQLHQGFVVRATISGVPLLNGPVIPIDPSSVAGGKQRPGDFVHPGLWHTHEDLEEIRGNVLAGIDPWANAYEKFSIDSYSQADYVMQGPYQVLSRGSISNYTAFTKDVRAAWQNALMWYITKNQSHWDRSTTILDAWGSNLTNVIGTDASLMIGLEGDMFVNAAEIMRWEGGWVEAGSKWQGGSGFSIQLYWLFARQSIINGQANYGMVSIKALMSFAAYLDDVAMWNYALNLMYNDRCAGIYGNYDADSGQPTEAGRDMGHVQSGLAWSAYGGRVMRSQGGADLFGLSDNLLLRASEYTAKYNLNNSVVYDPKVYRCEAVLVGGPWQNISTENRGIGGVPCWDIIYYEYVVRRGLEAPYTTQARTAFGFEGARPQLSGSADQASWGDLVWATLRNSSSKV